MNRNSKEFKELQEKWYAKLKKKGFEDIEVGEDQLKSWSSHYYKCRFTADSFKAKEDYYRLAAQFLNDNKFKNRTEKLVWRLHSEGMSIRDITAYLATKGKKTYKDWVQVTIARLRDEMVITCR